MLLIGCTDSLLDITYEPFNGHFDGSLSDVSYEDGSKELLADDGECLTDMFSECDQLKTYEFSVTDQDYPVPHGPEFFHNTIRFSADYLGFDSNSCYFGIYEYSDSSVENRKYQVGDTLILSCTQRDAAYLETIKDNHLSVYSYLDNDGTNRFKYADEILVGLEDGVVAQFLGKDGDICTFQTMTYPRLTMPCEFKAPNVPQPGEYVLLAYHIFISGNLDFISIQLPIELTHAQGYFVGCANGCQFLLQNGQELSLLTREKQNEIMSLYDKSRLLNIAYEAFDGHFDGNLYDVSYEDGTKVEYDSENE